jgi:hypothetical protein
VFGKLNVGIPPASPSTSPPVSLSSLSGLNTPPPDRGPFGNGLMGLMLGNDGNLWFSGTVTDESGNVSGIIGKVPPVTAGSPAPAPTWTSIPSSASALGFGPGLVNNTEVFLYRASDGVNIATISTDLSGFHHQAVTGHPSPFSGDTDMIGDLLAAPDGSVYVSVIPSNSSSGSMYHIDNSGQVSLSTNCEPVASNVYRLPDGTGIGIAGIGIASIDFPRHFLHVVPGPPGRECTPVPAADGKDASGALTQGDGRPLEFTIDVTTDDFRLYNNPHGHRRGIF